MNVYMAGPINACSDGEAGDWRTELKNRLYEDPRHCVSPSNGINFIDPMARDFRGIEGSHTDGIVEGDLMDIQASDIVIANCWKPSAGTSMEIFYARHVLGKHVIVLHPEGSVSPWLKYHSNDVVHSIDDLEAAIKSRTMYY